MKACWLKTPVDCPGQLKKSSPFFVDGAFFANGFTATTKRKQDLVYGRVPARIEGSPGTVISATYKETGQQVVQHGISAVEFSQGTCGGQDLL